MFNRFAAISGSLRKLNRDAGNISMRASSIHSFGLMMLVIVLTLAFAPCAALAQDSANAAYASASPPSNPTDEPTTPEANMPTLDENAVLGNSLMFDPSTLSSAAPAKKLRKPSASFNPSLDIKTTEKSDGSSTMAMKQPLPNNANVGADLGLAASAPDGYRPGRPLPGSRDDRNAGAAWASVGVMPNFASVDARVDPSNDQGKLGTTFKHAMPIGSNFSMTLEDSYSVTETFSAAPTGPADLPLMVAPVNSPTPAIPQVWGNEKGAKFDVLPTGTTIGAKFASTNIDPVTHNTLSAEQKLYGPLHVTTAVTDVGQPTKAKSITAGFKLNW
jgi:hypothetical protein